MREGLVVLIAISIVSFRPISSFGPRVPFAMKATPLQRTSKRARGQTGATPMPPKRAASSKHQNDDTLSSQHDEAFLKKTVEVNAASTIEKMSVAEQINALAEAKARSGWRLRDGLTHVAAANGGVLLPLMERHGLPTCFTADTATSDRRSGSSKNSGSKGQASSNSASSDPAAIATAVKPPVKETAYLGLCRIIVGQQLAGAAAQAVSVKLLAHFHEGGATNGGGVGLTPKSFLAAVSTPAELETLRAAVG